MIKKLLIFFIAILLTSCNLFLGIPLGEKIQYLPFRPVSVFIDENDNGVISDSVGIIYKIINLNLSSEINNSGKYILNTYDKYTVGYPIKIINFKSNGVNNGNMTYLYDNHLRNGDNFFLNNIEIENNYFKLDSKKNISSFNISKPGTTFSLNNIINSGEVGGLKISDNYIGIFRQDFKKIILDLYKNGQKESHEIVKDYNGIIKIIDLKIDEYGNGWYVSSGNYGNIVFQRIKNYKMESSEIISEVKFEIYVTKNSFNKEGNGFIIFKERSNYSIKTQKYKEFKLIPEPNLSDYDLVQATHFNNEGNGIAIISKEIKEYNNTKYYHYLKNISKYNIDSKEIKLLDNSYFKYIDSFINDKGNGLIFFSKDGENSCIIKKIINYEIEK